MDDLVVNFGLEHFKEIICDDDNDDDKSVNL
jgi:hypothetical protein